ncbi:hypothetical protein AXF42_Ash013242 [Apostasia shenzhenica]|uniref:Methyltransferase-like protein 13 n=1 Tax=Apostasia shenzhenica TaxID=1088818 RepID=A0A2I0BBG6_9ASPA|nr:hypothetical protein AXF42_Ash013242 [Apostasia shenzhenica]
MKECEFRASQPQTMWRVAGCRWKREVRRISSAVCHRLEDEGHWIYSPEWWGDGGIVGHTVFRSTSEHGNGVVSVAAYPSSRPGPEEWPKIERRLQERHVGVDSALKRDEQLKILGYQWRVLRFNDDTRQSTVKVMAAYRAADPASLYLMQQPHCLAVPSDLKSMVSAGLTALSSSGFNLHNAVNGKATMNVLCIGHGGGSLPLFLASKIRGAMIDVVEIDPVVISASIQAMGFPAFAAMRKPDQLSVAQPAESANLLWGNMHDQLSVHKSDAADFIDICSNIYDLVFIDAYDGDDIFPHKLWDRNGPFLKSLRSRLDLRHGTIVVNLHADTDENSILPMGKYVMQVCRAYKELLGLAFAVSVPWICNLTLVASTRFGLGSAERRLPMSSDMVLNSLASKSNMVDFLLDLPFPSLQYIKRGFVLID